MQRHLLKCIGYMSMFHLLWQSLYDYGEGAIALKCDLATTLARLAPLSKVER